MRRALGAVLLAVAALVLLLDGAEPALLDVLTGDPPRPAATAHDFGDWRTARWEGTPQASPTAGAAAAPSATATPGVAAPTAAPTPCPTTTAGDLADLEPEITVSGTTATLGWTYGGDPRVTGYQVGWHMEAGNKRQREAPIVWTPYPVSGCTAMTATLTSLEPGLHHVFVVVDWRDLETGREHHDQISNQFFRVGS